MRTASSCSIAARSSRKANQPRSGRMMRCAKCISYPAPMAADTPMLAVEAIDVFYGRAKILHGVSFEAKAGEIVALAGRNGAGKSTTMKANIGLVPPASGVIAFEGRAVAGA